MKSDIGAMIRESRTKMGLTQDQFAMKYNITGPAIFKFEKSYVKPSLKLWLDLSSDMAIKEKEAVVLWIQAKLPAKYRSFVTLRDTASKKKGKAKAAKPPSADELRKSIIGDRSAAKGLKELLKDKDIWILYKPKAEEIEILQKTFGQLGNGSKSAYREALRLIREFNEY